MAEPEDNTASRKARHCTLPRASSIHLQPSGAASPRSILIGPQQVLRASNLYLVS
jgi:hypothetical protein